MYLYYVASIIFFSGTLLFESACTALLAKVISPKLKLSFWNAGLIAGSNDTLGRFGGNISYTIITNYISKASVTFYAYIIDLVILTILLILSIIFIKRLIRQIIMKVNGEKK